MDIKAELLAGAITDLLYQRLEGCHIDASEIADTEATKALGEIKKIIQDWDRYDDPEAFMAIDKIVDVFYKYHIDSGCRHDF